MNREGLPKSGFRYLLMRAKLSRRIRGRQNLSYETLIARQRRAPPRPENTWLVSNNQQGSSLD
jgi:hypothetical protein